LLRVTKEAQQAMLGLEALDLKQLEALRRHYRAMGENQVFDLDSLNPTHTPKPHLDQC
jgi:low affinity Fe/Cu permease